MTIPHRSEYRIGQRVLVEGVVTDWEFGRPYGAVTVRFPEATDPQFLLDGVDAVVPQAVVNVIGVDVAALNDFAATEGYYPEENE